jgi:thioredoxin 1
MSEIRLTSDNFDATVLQSAGLVFVDFWAPWCAPCKIMMPVVEELASDFPLVVVATLNVDDDPEIAQRYNVLSIPTFMVFKGGRVVEQFSGSMTKEALRERIEEHMG